ncbi:MAG: ATP-dependent 6-phosphofructokinase [Oligoflexia bacterium]|nr:ATP-dependent 6-phosphofructokinase [Oligoflexia bacterium]
MGTSRNKGVVGVLTGGGDVPGLNPAIRGVTMRAIKDGYSVIGIKNGWEGLINIHRDRKIEEQEYCRPLSILDVENITTIGGTILHSSRTNPISIKRNKVPEHLRDKFFADNNDLTSEVLKNLEYLGITHLIPIGGDDTLSFAVHLHKQGLNVIAIPKTMDNDIPGTDSCLGYSTCLTRTVDLCYQLRTCAYSHQRFLVLEAFGRYAGFTALVPTIAGAADRCVIPEFQFDIRKLTQLLVEDRNRNPGKFSVVLVSEGAMFEGGHMIFQDQDTDGFGHKKLGGIGELVGNQLKKFSAEFNKGKSVEVINQRLGYLVRSGNPDAMDSILGAAYGNLAMELIEQHKSGLMVCLNNGHYDSVAIETIISYKKLIDVEKFYDKERYRPLYKNFNLRSMWVA